MHTHTHTRRGTIVHGPRRRIGLFPVSDPTGSVCRRLVCPPGPSIQDTQAHIGAMEINDVAVIGSGIDCHTYMSEVNTLSLSIGGTLQLPILQEPPAHLACSLESPGKIRRLLSLWLFQSSCSWLLPMPWALHFWPLPKQHFPHPRNLSAAARTW